MALAVDHAYGGATGESASMYSPELDTAIVVVSTKVANAITPPPMIQALALAIYGKT